MVASVVMYAEKYILYINYEIRRLESNFELVGIKFVRCFIDVLKFKRFARV